MSRRDDGPDLRGRHRECQLLEQLVTSVRAGQSRVLVVRGEAGIGKTALLEHLASHASGCRIARAGGVESEMELAFAGLHQLCTPFLDRLDRLPAPQRDALETAFALRSGNTPDRFLIGLAALSLLSDVAEDRPLVCLVDDAQWLDHASVHTLTFVARRLFAESVALVFATRATDEDHAFRPLPELPLTGLNDDDSRALLRTALRSPLDAAVLDEIVAETRGNPLALLELPRGRTPAQLAFGLGLPRAMPMAGRIEEGFLRRLEPLPVETRRLLLTAAIEPLGDVNVLWRAAERLGIRPDAGVPAAEAGLIEFGTRVRFRHPLVRSAAWRNADVRDLRAAHAALAAVTELDPDRRAWHRAHATTEPDEVVATELERSADRAQARGGFAAAAAFLERAAELTPDPVHRTSRVLAAAQARLQAGEFDPALDLLATAGTGPVDDLGRARIDLLRARIAYASRRGNEAARLLLAAAKRLEPLDIELARETYLSAFSAAMYAGRFASPADLEELAAAVPRATTDRTRKRDVLLQGLAALVKDGYSAALPIIRRALRAYRTEEISVADGLRSLWVAGVVAADVWDDESFHVLTARFVKMARDAGALSELLLALNSHIIMLLFAGEREAAAVVDEARAVREAIGSERPVYEVMVFAAWQGREDTVLPLIETSLSDVVARGEGIGAAVAQWANALLFNGLGRYEDALGPARAAGKCPQELAAANWGLAELVESAARTGATDLAADALEQLSAMTRASGTDWALGVESRSRALLSEGDTAERLYRESVERLSRTRVRAELARARLLYGEWLRREGRRLDAREHLRAAHELFSTMGADGFAERARRELLATGETARKRTIETRDELTAQEAQIARLAAHSHTNSEIGAQLFISPRTVEWHLRKVFTKLGLSSRKELSEALPEAGPRAHEGSAAGSAAGISST
ncbi:AAA family ATPase [Pseudonocardia sp. DSM 110487]|uniref:helix-turn-helix transcriptional regulator n=1 Tax=Pseudonocardia sp. DSM 110487 TaxID=2865833 RepID=UPI001C6A3ED2|nr:LuxR family transcriptional regulator [Pseudonocardia sp. DSM 110487]QYN34130.1 AAA family ATPase [Pseudonocardia sp. DSM 110487]